MNPADVPAPAADYPEPAMGKCPLIAPATEEDGSPRAGDGGPLRVQPGHGMIGAAPKRLAARPPGETPRTEAIEAGGTLFVVAPKRDGPPLAVTRIAGPSLPLAFALGPET